MKISELLQAVDGLQPARRGKADYLRLLRGCLFALLAVVVLGWLFAGADSVSLEEHQHYTRALDKLRQGDVQLNAAILANRLALHRDFDTLSSTLTAQQSTLQAIGEPPAYLTAIDSARLLDTLAEYRRLAGLKAEAIDRYQREVAILRNSLAFFPAATQSFIVDGAAPPALSREIGIFARGVTTYALNGDAELAHELAQSLRHLLRKATDPDYAQTARLRNLLAHASVILERKPTVDATVRDILELPTAEAGEQMVRLYNEGYGHGALRAHVHRVLLFVAALVLAAYLAVVIARLGRASRALVRANQDLQERIAALKHAQEELHLYATVFTNATEGMTITDAESHIVAVNPAFSRITGFAPAQVIGQTPKLLNSGRQDAGFYRDMWATLARRGQWQGEIWNRRQSGDVYPEWLSITAVRDTDGTPTHYIGIFSDITERKQTEARIRHLANHDALTGLPNRLLLQDRLNQAILQSRRDKRRAAVLFLDLDRFKTINDTLGHEVGDALLIQVTQRCLGAVRDTDTVARQGGDEFVIVLPELEHAQDAAMIARKLLSALASPFQLGPHALTVTGSVGIALYPEDGQNESVLLRNADTAMYRAKDDGRNGFQFYSADMNTASLGELLLENQLRGALERGELRLHYQPKVCPRGHAVVAAEALLRWQHPELGLLSPGRFVPVAEESGLIVPMGEWVIREACRQLRAWQDEGRVLVPVAVNLSAQQFVHQDIVALVREALNDNDLPAHLLELELTETMLMRDADRTVHILAQLRAMGVSLAIDDFGSGYSSLAYLKRFQVQTLKIDRSFVHDIREGGEDGEIAAAVIALAHNLGQQVVAEGVETEYQRDFLTRQGCDLLQGFLFGRPQAAEDFATSLASLQMPLDTLEAGETIAA